MDNAGNLVLLSNAEQGIWLGKVRVNRELVSSQTVSDGMQHVKAHRVLPYRDGGWIVAITKRSDKVPSTPGRGKLGFVHQAPESSAPTVLYLDDERFLDTSLRDMVKTPDKTGYIVTGTVQGIPKDGTRAPFVLKCDEQGRIVWYAMDMSWITDRGIDRIGAISVDSQHNIHVLGSSVDALNPETKPAPSWIKLNESGKEIGYKVLSSEVHGAVQASTLDEGSKTLWAAGVMEGSASKHGRVWSINLDTMELASTIDIQQDKFDTLTEFTRSSFSSLAFHEGRLFIAWRFIYWVGEGPDFTVGSLVALNPEGRIDWQANYSRPLAGWVGQLIQEPGKSILALGFDRPKQESTGYLARFCPPNP